MLKQAFLKIKNVAPPKKVSYYTPTLPQWPPLYNGHCPVPKVAVVRRFDFNPYCLGGICPLTNVVT